jgi:hypothetical protein
LGGALGGGRGVGQVGAQALAQVLGGHGRAGVPDDLDGAGEEALLVLLFLFGLGGWE